MKRTLFAILLLCAAPAWAWDVPAWDTGWASGSGVTIRLTSDDDAAIPVGSIVVVDDDGDNRFKIAPGDSDMPLGIYQCNSTGCGSTATSTSGYLVAYAGAAYVRTVEDEDVVRGYVCYVSATAGIANCDATAPAATTHNREIGHTLVSEAMDTFNGASDVDPDLDTIANVSTTWAVGDPVQFWDSADTPPTGLTDGAVYFVKTNVSGTVTLCATKGCTTAVNITADGSGTTMYLQRLPLVLLHFN